MWQRKLRHRVQSLVEGATDPWDQVKEYEIDIPESEEDEFIDEEAAEVAEEVIEFTYAIRELGAEMILGEDRLFESLLSVSTELKRFSVYLGFTEFLWQKLERKKIVAPSNIFL